MKISVAVLALGSSLLLAQEVPLQFEVASVRPSGPPQPEQPRMVPLGRGGPGTTDPEHLIYERTPFQRIVMDAYGVERDQIQGPDWATSDAVATAALFDISAKVPTGATKQQVAVMLQNLLRDRFKLELHHTTVEHYGFALVLAKGGSRLKESVGLVEPSERNASTGGAVNLQTQKDGFPELYPGSSLGSTFKESTVRMRFRDFSVSQLVQQTSFILNARTVDKTGLTGRYDFTLEFTLPENAFILGIRASLPLTEGQTSPINPTAPNAGQEDWIPVVSSAMEKQFGLKLEAAKIPVDTIVIDKIERTPAEN